MVNVSGRAKVVNEPVPSDGSTDLNVEYARGKWLLLLATNYVMKQAILAISKGDVVTFTGLLQESEPGYYFVKLSSIKKVGVFR